MLNTEWLKGYEEGRFYEIARIIRLIENGCCQHNASGCPDDNGHQTQENVIELTEAGKK